MSMPQALKDHPHLLDIDAWGSISAIRKTLKPARDKKFLLRVRMIKDLLAGLPYSKISSKHGISKGRISQLLKRCTTPDENGEMPLIAGLIPCRRVKKYERKESTEMSDYEDDQGMWGEIVKRNPRSVNSLLLKLYKHIKREKGAENMTKSRAHRYLLDKLSDEIGSENCFPFLNVRQGYVSFCRHYDRWIKELSMPKPQWDIGLLKYEDRRVYEQIEIDEQKMDLGASHDFIIDGRHIAQRLSRISIAVAVEPESNAVIQYYLCFAHTPSHEDLLYLFDKLRKPWKPKKLVYEKEGYPPCAAFPTAVHEIYQNISLGVIKLDNAMSHHANRLRRIVCFGFGATLNPGRIKKPKDRLWVEGMFNILNELTHRFDSTTGSSPTDPLKETSQNYKTPPILNVDHLEELLDIFFATYNAKPHPRLNGFSPLEILRQQADKYPLPIDFDYAENRTGAMLDTETVTVRQNVKDGARPHINYSTLKYKGSCICDPDLVNTNITIKIDISDIRTVEAFTVDGKLLGTLYCQKSRQGSQLSLRTRKQISKYTDKHKDLAIKTADDYFDHLDAQDPTPTIATEKVRLLRERKSTRDRNQRPMPSQNKKNRLKNNVKRRKSKVKDWTPSMVKN